MRTGMLSFALAAVTMLAVVGWGIEHSPPQSKVYSLQEFSVFDPNEGGARTLQSGQITTDCGTTPSDSVTYPDFKSQSPVYGTVMFNMSLFDPQAGLLYHFALDESAGTGKGYDRLYFDADGDSDLTDRAPVGSAKTAAEAATGRRADIAFETVQVKLDYGPGQGTFTQAVVPRLMKSGENVYMFFTASTARKGKIMLGSEEVELVLGQAYTIAGRYDSPMIGAFLTGREQVLPFAGYWPLVDGAFYSLSVTPAGDKVTVTPYAGPFGTLKIKAGDENAAAPTIQYGWIHSRDAILDVHECMQEDGTLKVPVGDYRPFRIAVACGQRSIGLAVDTSRIGHKDAPAVFPIQIRPDKPCVFDLAGKLDVVFKTPAAGDRIEVGQTLKVEAALCDLTRGLMVAAIDDTTKKVQSLQLPGGRSMDIFESVSPTIKIADSSGRVVAEGTMPFG